LRSRWTFFITIVINCPHLVQAPQEASYCEYHSTTRENAPYATYEDGSSALKDHPAKHKYANSNGPIPNAPNSEDWMRFRRKKQVAQEDDKHFNILSGKFHFDHATLYKS
jgi:hypothetical protein